MDHFGYRPRAAFELGLFVPQQRTCGHSIGKSELCQQETHALHKMTFLFDHLVGERK
jgi:hypothetical protein